MADKITLKKIELTNYRNIEHAVLEFNGNSKIVGENRIGKTNTLESINFLLTNYLLNGSIDLASIKPLKDTKLVVKVEGVFQVGDKEITLKKEYAEDWVKQRNTDQLIFKGHYENYYYNGVKQSTIKDYNRLLAEDFGVTQDPNTKIDYFKMLANPFYLGDLGESDTWSTLRQFIIDLVGDVSDEDVFNAEPSTRAIQKDLIATNGRIDQLKKQYKGESDSLNDLIIGNDAQIDMLEKTEKPSEEEFAIAKKGVDDINDEIAMLKSQNGIDNASVMIREKIAKKTAEIFELKDKERKEQLASQSNSSDGKEKLDELYKKSNDITYKISSKNFEMSKCIGNIETWTTEINECDRLREQFIKEIKEIDELLVAPDKAVETVCPTCGRPYEEEKTKEIVENYVKGLNDKRNAVIEKGKANKQKKLDTEEKVKTEKENYNSVVDAKTKLEQDLEEIKSEIAELNKSLTFAPTEYVPSQRVLDLVKEKVNLEEELRKAGADYQSALDTVNTQIYEKEQSKEKFGKVIQDMDYYERTMLTLERVREERATNSQKLIDVEQKKDLLNKFIFTKLKMLDSNVSKVFGNIKFQLIKENINGGFDPICKPYIYNISKDESTKVSWRNGSKSERVITGIAILEKVKEKLNLPDLPLLFDEGGEISTDTFATKLKTNAQIICVKVQDNVPSPMVLAI